MNNYYVTINLKTRFYVAMYTGISGPLAIGKQCSLIIFLWNFQFYLHFIFMYTPYHYFSSK